MQERDRKDKANQRDPGRPKKIADGQGNGVSSSRPVGNSVEAALRRLRKARPDALVLAGEMTAHAAMIEAGFRKPRPRKPSALDALKRHWQRATPEEQAAFLRQHVHSTAIRRSVVPTVS